MTNRTNKGKSKNSIGLLDLSFDSQDGQHGVNVTPSGMNNGIRPHGGLRGTSQYPPSLHSFDKDADYHKQLARDLNNLIGSDTKKGRIRSPSWAIKVSKQPNHSGESPLFINRLLAPSRLEQAGHFDEKKKRSRPASGRSASARFYRPNSTHQYLSQTHLKDEARAEVDVKLGKPTRTSHFGKPTRASLLRARQRCNSAPVNAYNIRREQQQKLDERLETRRSYSHNTNITMRDLLSSTNGESLHSFLIGARYNRAHCLDAKSYDELGVYMPRHNPLGCFVVKKDGQTIITGQPPEPNAPPDTPASLSDDESDHEGGVTDHLAACHVDDTQHSHLTNGHAGSKKGPEARQAWDEEGSSGGERDTKVPIMEHLMNLDDGLNVKGTGMPSGPVSSPHRPRSSRSRHQVVSVPVGGDIGVVYDGSRPHSARSGLGGSLPNVRVQGTSIGSSSRGRDPIIEQALRVNDPSLHHPVPPTRPHTGVGTRTQPPAPPPRSPTPSPQHSYTEEGEEEEGNQPKPEEAVVEDQTTDDLSKEEEELCSVDETTLENNNLEQPETVKAGDSHIQLENKEQPQEIVPQENEEIPQENEEIPQDNEEIVTKEESVIEGDLQEVSSDIFEESNGLVEETTSQTSCKKVRFADEVEHLEEKTNADLDNVDKGVDESNVEFFITEESSDRTLVNGAEGVDGNSQVEEGVLENSLEKEAGGDSGNNTTDILKDKYDVAKTDDQKLEEKGNMKVDENFVNDEWIEDKEDLKEMVIKVDISPKNEVADEIQNSQE